MSITFCYEPLRFLIKEPTWLKPSNVLGNLSESDRAPLKIKFSNFSSAEASCFFILVE